jgi:sortase A
MRRAPLVLTATGVLLLLVSLAAVVLSRLPASQLATVGSALTTVTSLPSSLTPHLATPSATPEPTPEPTQAAQRNAAAVAAAAAPPTSVVARLSIPRIGVRSAPIYDRGTDAKGIMLIAPGYAVTHYAFSAPFGTGNAVLYGHDDIQGNIFGRLYDLAPGDLIQITVGGQMQTYRVSGHQIVAPTAVSVLAPTSDVRLTIITCWPFNVDTKRWIVTAVKV